MAGWIGTDEQEPERGADGRPRTRDGQPVTHQTTRLCPICRPEAGQALADTMLTHGQQFSKFPKRKER
ncbi:hypothetical protein AB0E04_17315 [Streptomyces sp. NPDC048251]|uniref:hypothetical protein n=1 Tax=Streptomyces sp. NPDC048251 TaxID=3154501 RepID=UPI00343755B1